MTDEQLTQLEAETEAAYTVSREHRRQADASLGVWSDLLNRIHKEKLRRQMLAEIAAEKGQS